MGTTTAVIQHRGRQRMHQQQWSQPNEIGSPVPSVPTRPVLGPLWFCWRRDGRARPLGRGLHVVSAGLRADRTVPRPPPGCQRHLAFSARRGGAA